MKSSIRLRALEKKDLRFVHSLNNNRTIMSYWFEEPYESFDELEDLYSKERSFNNFDISTNAARYPLPATRKNQSSLCFCGQRVAAFYKFQ